MKITTIPSWVNGKEFFSENNLELDKYNPQNEEFLYKISQCSKVDVDFAIDIADKKFKEWSSVNPVNRGEILFKFSQKILEYKDILSTCISIETGKSIKDSNGEVQGSIKVAQFFSGEGMRLYSNSLTSGMDNKYSHTTRAPIGIAGLIIPANTPLANIAWKIFPALICGNSVILKASEDAPRLAFLIGKISKESGLPDGVLNIIQGDGIVTGNRIVESKKVKIISFTGSTYTGKIIAKNVLKILKKFLWN